LNAEQIFKEQTTELNDFKDLDFGWSFELGMEFYVLKNPLLYK